MELRDNPETGLYPEESETLMKNKIIIHAFRNTQSPTTITSPPLATTQPLFDSPPPLLQQGQQPQSANSIPQQSPVNVTFYGNQNPGFFPGGEAGNAPYARRKYPNGTASGNKLNPDRREQFKIRQGQGQQPYKPKPGGGGKVPPYTRGRKGGF
jgi:hypothetical protein